MGKEPRMNTDEHGWNAWLTHDLFSHVFPCASVVSVVLLICALVAGEAHAQIAVKGGTVYTMAGEPIQNGVVLVQDGRITAVGPAREIQIPLGYAIHEAAVVTPGLIDAHGTVGLTGIYNQDHDQDQIERSGAIQPELRALDAYNAHEELVAYLRSFGVTSVHTGHAPGELVSGQTMIVKTVGNTAEQAMIVETAAIAATLGPGARRSGGSPGTRGKMMAMLRAELIKAQEYLDERVQFDDVEAEDEREAHADAEESGDEEQAPKEQRMPPRNLRLEALGRVLSRELPLLITAHKAQDIASALRLAEEFNIRIILDGAAESYLLVDEILAAQVPVILHPSMQRMYGELENASFETATKLREAGVPIAMQSGYEGYVPKTRVVLLEAAIYAANGLGMQNALAAITRDAAVMLGIDDRVGTLQVGKDADIALYDGDPFEYTTKCLGTIIDGKLVSDTPR